MKFFKNKNHISLLYTVMIIFIVACSGGSGGSGEPDSTEPLESSKGAYSVEVISTRGNQNGESAIISSDRADPGEAVSLTALLPEDGRQVDIVSTEAIFSTTTIYHDGESAKFIMPQEDVSISVEFSTSSVDLFSLESGEVVKMQYAPGGSFTSVLTSSSGENSTVSPFWIGETEVTYEFWTTVRQWAMTRALDERYTFAAGAKGGTNTLGSGAGHTIDDQHPVSTISWRDAAVFANAVTEYYNSVNPASEEDLTLVYYTDSTYQVPLRNAASGQAFSDTPGTVDNPYILAGSTGNTEIENTIATGFRIPTSAEWEFGARYNKDGSYTPANYVSGGTSPVDMINPVAASEFAVFNIATTAPIRGERKANSLGVYDMSGNVWEFTYDGYTADNIRTRIIVGGNFFFTVAASLVSTASGNLITFERNDVGLRLVRSAGE